MYIYKYIYIYTYIYIYIYIPLLQVATQPGISLELDRFQSKLVAAILRTPRTPGEAPDVYCRRRNKATATLCRQIGLWSRHWHQQAINWDSHICRGHNPYSWPSLLKGFHGEAWLEEQRMLTGNHGTKTRVAAGRPAMRWDEGTMFARRALMR